MKKLALVVLVLVLVIGIAIFVYGRWRRAQIEAIGKQAEAVELLHGPVAASIYARCHLHPPTTKEHQAECKQVDDLVAADRANAAKNQK